jgi:class 3 adenylate cyclase/tetratricopeptide (TPR) repeat protein
VTVLFCDLVGSTDLSSRLDPEELCQLMRCYQATCAEAITPFGGYIAQTLGDGLLVYFGFPEAHEDDAVRAVRAGLAAVAAVADESAPLALGWGPCAVRVGIYTGVVFAGEVGRFDTRIDRALIGETPNIAARLQAIAGRSEVLVGPTTRSLIEGNFRLESLGKRALKGLPEPLEVFRVSERTRSATRFRGRKLGALAPLIGRESELSVLRTCWAQARAGDGQLVLIAGVAGIGKSRLAEAFRAELSADTRVLVYQCLPYFQHTALYPVAAQLRDAAGIRRRDSESLKLAKLRRLLAVTCQATEVSVGRWARVLRIATTLAPELDQLSPRRLLDDTIDHATNELIAMSREQPVFVLIEDAHWSDTVSRRLIATVSERILEARVMLVITDRSGFAGVSRLDRVVGVRLQGLAHVSSHSIIAHLTPHTQLPRRVTDEIIRRSEGIPFFVEELTKAVLESEHGLSAPLVPASIKDSLTARLDRIGPNKVIAQRGACIGSSFSYEMICFVSGLERAALDRGLENLVEVELLSCSGELPDARFSFRHSLLQDAVYESMLLQERRAVHLAIAHKLERETPLTCAQEPELLARHFYAAGDARTAAKYWLSAGEAAQARSAHVDAIAHLTQGLRALSELTRDVEDDIREIQIQSALARSLMAGEGWAGPRVHAAYTRARELAQARQDIHMECELLWGLCAQLSVRGAFSEASALASEYVELAQRTGDRSALLMADSAAVLACACKGEFAQAQRHAARIHERYRDLECEQLVQVYNHDPLVLACVHESVWLWVQGQPDRAAYASERGIQRARELRHSFHLCYTLVNGCCIRLLRGETKRALELVDEALALSNEQRIPLFKLYAPLMGAPALFEREPSAETLAWLERCLAVLRSAEVGMHMPLYLAHIASAYHKLGASLEAEARIVEALEVVERTSERWIECELLRIRAAISRHADPHGDAAELQLWTALQCARSAGARGFELRIACDLGELLDKRGRRGEVEELVASVLSTFDEGLGTADLCRARTWLEG